MGTLHKYWVTLQQEPSFVPPRGSNLASVSYKVPVYSFLGPAAFVIYWTGQRGVSVYTYLYFSMMDLTKKALWLPTTMTGMCVCAGIVKEGPAPRSILCPGPSRLLNAESIHRCQLMQKEHWLEDLLPPTLLPLPPPLDCHVDTKHTTCKIDPRQFSQENPGQWRRRAVRCSQNWVFILLNGPMARCACVARIRSRLQTQSTHRVPTHYSRCAKP